MGIPSENKTRSTRSRKEPDSAAFSPKPELDEKRKSELRGQDKRQGDLRQDEPESRRLAPRRAAKQRHHHSGVNMQSKAGLQDDHDPRDIGQKQNDVPEGIKDKQHGVQNPPKEDQRGEQKKQPGQQY
jgi:hypothetical protein